MTSAQWLIGVDDTDWGESIGTGALARELMLHLQRVLGLRHCGITRHQLLVHPDIPYTSHNSSACLSIEGEVSLGELVSKSKNFMDTLFHNGADPALCICTPADALALTAFGQRAQREVLLMGEVLELCAAAGIYLEPLGGTGQGVIGAASACGLRAGGEDGRFISLRGIRALQGRATVAHILSSTDVAAVVDAQGGALPADAEIETLGWVRPDLRGGRAVLETVRDETGRVQVVRPAGKGARKDG